MVRLKVSTINKAIILLVAFLASGGITLFIPIENQNMNRDNLLIAFLAILSCFITLCKKRNNNYYKPIKNYIIVFSSIICVFIGYSTVLYGYSIVETVKLSATYWYVLFAPGVLSVLLKENNEKLIDDICIIGYIFIIIRFISWLSVNYIGINIFTNYLYEYEGWARNGNVRLVGGPLFYFIYFWLLYRYLTSSRVPIKIWFGILISFLLFYNVFVTQSRIGFSIMIIGLIWIYYFLLKRSISKFFFVILMILSIAILAIGGILDSFFSSFNINNSVFGMSSLARLEGLKHFSQLFVTKGNCIGLGFVSSTLSKTFFRGSKITTLYLEDLGMLEVIFRFGICFIPMLFSLIFKGYKTSKILIKTNCSLRYMIVSLEIIFVLVNILASIFIKQYAISSPLFIALIFYVEIRIRSVGDLNG